MSYSREAYWRRRYYAAKRGNEPAMTTGEYNLFLVVFMLMAWGILQLIIQAIFGRTVAEIYGVITTAIWAYLAIRWIVRTVNRISNAIYKSKTNRGS